MEELIKHLFGEQNWAWWVAVLIWAFIGCLLNLYFYAVNTRNKYSSETPNQFSIGFLMWDNIQRLVIGFILSFICIRFSMELLGTEVTIYIGFVYGLGSDKLAGLLSKAEMAARGK